MNKIPLFQYSVEQKKLHNFDFVSFSFKVFVILHLEGNRALKEEEKRLCQTKALDSHGTACSFSSAVLNVMAYPKIRC